MMKKLLPHLKTIALCLVSGALPLGIYLGVTPPVAPPPCSEAVHVVNCNDCQSIIYQLAAKASKDASVAAVTSKEAPDEASTD